MESENATKTRTRSSRSSDGHLKSTKSTGKKDLDALPYNNYSNCWMPFRDCIIKPSPIVHQQSPIVLDQRNINVRKPRDSHEGLKRGHPYPYLVGHTIGEAQFLVQPKSVLSVDLYMKQEHSSSCHQIPTVQKEDINEAVQHPQEEDEDDDLSLMVSQFKANGWLINPSEIEFKEKVAQGSTATVHKATWRGLEVAVKCMNPEFFTSNENSLSFFIQELLTLSVQRHPYVLQLMGACLNPPEHGWVVTEFLKTTLTEWLHGPGSRRKERTVELPPLRKRVIKALEISQAMQYLHERKPMLIHRDLKPSNIFLDDSDHVRVADFGHATLLGDGEKALTGETGTYVYMAPEVFLSKPYNEKCDVFSFGVIMNELLTGDYPYIDMDLGPYQIAAGVAAGELRPTVTEEDNVGEVVHLICQCWDSDESVRPSFRSITPALMNILRNINQM